jgi:hypothetical protein
MAEGWAAVNALYAEPMDYGDKSDARWLRDNPDRPCRMRLPFADELVDEDLDNRYFVIAVMRRPSSRRFSRIVLEPGRDFVICYNDLNV